MGRNLTFSTILLAATINASAAPVKVPQSEIAVTFQGAHSEVKREGTVLYYKDTIGSRSLKIEKCNEAVINDFFKEFELEKHRYNPLPNSMLGPRSVLLSERKGKISKINPVSRFGFWLRKMPSEISLIFIKAKSVCGKIGRK